VDEAPPDQPQDARAALRLLMAGNRRWARGRPRHPHQSVAWRRYVPGHLDSGLVEIIA
jgi:carbonic anhydrase